MAEQEPIICPRCQRDLTSAYKVLVTDEQTRIFFWASHERAHLREDAENVTEIAVDYEALDRRIGLLRTALLNFYLNWRVSLRDMRDLEGLTVLLDMIRDRRLLPDAKGSGQAARRPAASDGPLVQAAWKVVNLYGQLPNMVRRGTLSHHDIADMDAAMAALETALRDTRAGRQFPEPMVTLTFRPQVWQNDYAVDVDSQGPTTWQVPRSRLAGIRRGTHEADDLRHDEAAPQWCKDWTGPFEIEWDDQEPGPEPQQVRPRRVPIDVDVLKEAAEMLDCNCGPRCTGTCTRSKMEEQVAKARGWRVNAGQGGYVWCEQCGQEPATCFEGEAVLCDECHAQQGEASHTPFREAVMQAWVDGWNAGLDDRLQSDDDKRACADRLQRQFPWLACVPGIQKIIQMGCARSLLWLMEMTWVNRADAHEPYSEVAAIAMAIEALVDHARRLGYHVLNEDDVALGARGVKVHPIMTGEQSL